MKITEDIVKNIIDSGDIAVEFQPIYSLNTQKIIALEALSRGICGDKKVSPFALFEYADRNGRGLELDRLCREKAMRQFSMGENRAPTLCINFDSNLLNGTKPDPDEIVRTAEACRISPQNVVIELNCSLVKDAFDLTMFAGYYRSKGFLIALDNVSAGADTINRIMLVNPDFIKIDRAIVSNIGSNTYNQEFFRTVINTAQRMGAMTVAVGAETADDVITCMLMGVDYLQGYYFQKPEQFNYLFTNEAIMRLEQAAQKLNISTKKNPTVESIRIESCKRMIYDLASRLAVCTPETYEKELASYISEHKEIECAFLINSKGFQITNTVMSPDTEIKQGYYPAPMGVNHDIKNYFYAIKEQIEDPFISGWYVSNATGNSCKTVSSKFYGSQGEIVIVCVDLKKQ